MTWKVYSIQYFGGYSTYACSHREVTEGQDAAFLAVVNEIEQAKDGYTAGETAEAVQTLFENLTTYLPAIEVKDSIDISFVMDDAGLDTGTSWSGLPALTNGMLRTTNTEVFTATQQCPVKLPLGAYGLLVRGYQRPGSASTCVKEYANGVNNVNAYVTFNTKTLRLKHIAQGGGSSRLNEGGIETGYSGIYVPTNLTAINAYLAAGRYDNLLKQTFAASKTATIGIKNTRTRCSPSSSDGS